ncbi:type IV pilin protein [Gynuella sunshinyii]|uniref:Tfp pilus assembly protein PilE n=1 Tax=Gynuella sunshinyii YC6258 TaxID=1445510 RepID=A0A0C5UYM7_9GAMM|nr:type IV pilin protein [Gynuella sunshinyii]AJQ92410.1 tfp pilus assembly protein PilE [Gynuella sunshinyii YC6258]
MKQKFSGFTLIEIMVVIAIISILAAVAYPSYMSQVRKSNRSDAKVVLSNVAQQLQRCFTAVGTYKPAAAGTCSVVDSITGSGVVSGEGYYVVKVANADLTATSYLLKATPVAGKVQANDKECAVFSLTQTGVRGAKNDGGTDTSSTCW